MASTDPNPKDVEFYHASVDAWFSTRLERDKSLLTLSAGGIGVLVILMSGIHTIESFLLFVLALVGFAMSVTAVLWVFVQNGAYLERVISRQNAEHDPDPLLTVLDNVAVATFFAGVILTGILGVATAWHSLETTERNMTAEEKDQRDALEKSFNRADKLKPAGQPAGTVRAPVSPPAPQPLSPQTPKPTKDE
jgi:hypothetical protein